MRAEAASGNAVSGTTTVRVASTAAPRQLPARHRLQPQIDEQAVFDEVAERRRAEPERRERHEDPEPVGRDGVGGRLIRVRVEAGEQPDHDGERAQGADAEQAGSVTCVRSTRR